MLEVQDDQAEENDPVFSVGASHDVVVSETLKEVIPGFLVSTNFYFKETCDICAAQLKLKGANLFGIFKVVNQLRLFVLCHAWFNQTNRQNILKLYDSVGIENAKMMMTEDVTDESQISDWFLFVTKFLNPNNAYFSTLSAEDKSSVVSDFVEKLKTWIDKIKTYRWMSRLTDILSVVKLLKKIHDLPCLSEFAESLNRRVTGLQAMKDMIGTAKSSLFFQQSSASRIVSGDIAESCLVSRCT